MKSRHKEIYFVFAIIIFFLIAFSMGAYFSTETCKSQASYMSKYAEECIYERGVYLDLCGDLDYLIENEEYQECINRCYE